MPPFVIKPNEKVRLLLSAFSKAFSESNTRYKTFTNYLDDALRKYDESFGDSEKNKRKRHRKNNYVAIAKRPKIDNKE